MQDQIAGIDLVVAERRCDSVHAVFLPFSDEYDGVGRLPPKHSLANRQRPVVTEVRGVYTHRTTAAPFLQRW